jgi:hypothetical protein
VTTMGDVPDKAGHEMTVDARHRFSALDRAFPYQKAASKGLYQAPIRDLDQFRSRDQSVTFDRPEFRPSCAVFGAYGESEDLKKQTVRVVNIL